MDMKLKFHRYIIYSIDPENKSKSDLIYYLNLSKPSATNSVTL